MPGSIGSRSPTAPDQGVCAISPSDLVGYVGNLVNTVNDLKQRVAELEAKNTETNQLSNISGQVGWVGGVTYMGIPGWTQTEYGTLIPPPGVTLASLGIVPPTIPGAPPNSLGITMVDANGNILFGFNPADGAYGDLVDAWNAATTVTGAAQDYVSAKFESGSWSHTERGITVTSTTSITMIKTITVQVAQSGLYFIDTYASLSVLGSAAANPVGASTSVFFKCVEDVTKIRTDTKTETILGEPGSPNTGHINIEHAPSALFLLNANDHILFSLTALAGFGGQTYSWDPINFTMTRISG